MPATEPAPAKHDSPTLPSTTLTEKAPVWFVLELLASGWSGQRILDEYPQLRADDLQAVFAFVRDCLKDGEPICGRLQPDKNALLYGVRAEDVASSALLPLPGRGLIAVGSRDANRFFPGMGTLFLRMMGEAFDTAMRRFEG